MSEDESDMTLTSAPPDKDVATTCEVLGNSSRRWDERVTDPDPGSSRDTHRATVQDALI